MTVADESVAAGQYLLLHANAVSLTAVILLAATYLLWPSKPDQVPALRDVIPYVSNTYQYMTDMKTFLQRASQALHRQNIVSFHLGPMKVYLMTGAQNVQHMFRTSRSISSDKFMLIVWENIWCFSKEDIVKFANDKTGRLRVPAPGTEATPEKERYWAGMHHILHDNLSRVSETNKLAATYRKLFGERLESYPVGEWSDVRVAGFLRKDMLEAAATSMGGQLLVEKHPDLAEALWDLDEVAANLAWGLPQWLNRDASKKRDRLHSIFIQHMKDAWDAFDWDSPDAGLDWEPVFGSRLIREISRWARDCGLTLGTQAGKIMSFIFAINSNTIPVTIWGVMELAEDPGLFQAIREEVLTVCETDGKTGAHVIDIPSLLSLPLLQSVYTELLRLHVSINVTREVMEPTTISGYRIEKGALLQAPSEIAQFAESVWSVEQHPASEFWAARHIRPAGALDDEGNVLHKPGYSMAGRSNDFFPYGGGVSICPGRFFAK